MHRAFCSRILFVYMSCNLSAFLSLIMLVYKIYVKRWRNVFILPGSQRRRPQLATLMKIAQSQSQILCQTKERRTTQRTVNRRGMRASLTSVGRSAVYSVLKVRPKCLTRHCTHETCLSVVCGCIRCWSGRRRAQSGAGDGAEQNGHTIWNGRGGLC